MCDCISEFLPPMDTMVQIEKLELKFAALLTISEICLITFPFVLRVISLGVRSEVIRIASSGVSVPF